ncbi:EamA family transporter [Streptomyces sp. MC1]|uniref:DMT family transporter n=1 Tax=Streptomyces sp. MC1 TaxID=295105 RepID=UPI0018CB3E80|nr:EamA family transporter [Streptomyces sp. MC1]MBG7697671.1 EamA family transporter [Streptomyces sp. MC1]
MRQQKRGFSNGAGLILGAALLWGTVGPAQALVGTSMGPVALGGWRLVVGGTVLAACARRHLPALLPALRHGLARPVLVCAIATGVYQAAFLYSTARTGAALATVVALGTAPVATGLIAWAVCGEHLTRTWMVSTAAAVTGCALLMAPTGTGVDAPGLLAATVSGVCYGLYTVYAKRLTTDHPDVHLPSVSALSLLLGAVPLVPWMAAGSAALGQPATLGLIAWLGLATTALPYGLFSIGITSTSAVAVGTLSLAEPLAASFLGVFVLHEHLTATAALGSLLMLGGLAAACLPSARTRPTTRPGGQSSAPPGHPGPLAGHAAATPPSASSSRAPARTDHR